MQAVYFLLISISAKCINANLRIFLLINILDIPFILTHLMHHFAAESQGKIEVKDRCACESLVEFQQVTMSTLDQLNQKHILYIFSPDPLNMLAFQHMQHCSVTHPDPKLSLA